MLSDNYNGCRWTQQLEDTLFNGDSPMESFNTENVDDCKEICAGKEQCRSYTYLLKPQMCFIYGDIGQREAFKIDGIGAISGFPFCEPDHKSNKGPSSSNCHAPFISAYAGQSIIMPLKFREAEDNVTEEVCAYGGIIEYVFDDNSEKAGSIVMFQFDEGYDIHFEINPVGTDVRLHCPEDVTEAKNFTTNVKFMSMAGREFVHQNPTSCAVTYECKPIPPTLKGVDANIYVEPNLNRSYCLQTDPNKKRKQPLGDRSRKETTSPQKKELSDFNTDLSSSGSGMSTGVLIVIIVGSLVGLLLIAGLGVCIFLYFRKKNRNEEELPSEGFSPMTNDSSARRSRKIRS